MPDEWVGDDGETHQIRAWATVNEKRVFHPHPTRDGELEFNGRVRDVQLKSQKMYYCVCDPDRHFRTDETARRHLEEVGALD